MPRSDVQHLTAVFEMRPTRRKAAALERARAASERLFWDQLDTIRDQADALIAQPDRKIRRAGLQRMEADAARAATRSGIVESVGAGVARDVGQSVSSYVGLRLAGQDASWPERTRAVTPTDYAVALSTIAKALSVEDERIARDDFARIARGESKRPLVLVRARDCRIVRDDRRRIAVVLNVVRATGERACVSKVSGGFDATTGEIVPQSSRRTAIIVPLACSLWHENRFLDGRSRLKSALIVRRGERWFLCAQFAMPIESLPPSGAAVGVDRGCIFPAATAVVSAEGAVVEVPGAQGAEIGRRIARTEERRRREQRRRGWTSLTHVRAVDNDLHLLANGIVERARLHRAEVVIEKLGEFKRTITAARPKGARKGGWRRVLKKAQLGKLEQMLGYKLALAGLPPLREVLAAGTSQTCPACGLRDPKSRVERDTFRCTGCGHELHADANAAIVIARRGVLMRTIKKGEKLDALHKNMVVGLRSRDDGGLGPLASSRRVVAAHVSAAMANDSAGASASDGLTLGAEQNATGAVENARKGIIAERDGRVFGPNESASFRSPSKRLRKIGSGGPENAG
jgi:Putative transposase DNA-binding domain